MYTKQGIIHIAVPTNDKYYSCVYIDVPLLSDTGGLYYYAKGWEKKYVLNDDRRIVELYPSI